MPLLVVGCRRQRQSREARRMVFLSRHRWVDLGGKSGRAMSAGLKEIMGKLGFDAREVFLKKGEFKVGMRVRLWCWLREEFQFRPMHLKAIDLLMMKGMRAHDGVGREELSARGA